MTDARRAVETGAVVRRAIEQRDAAVEFRRAERQSAERAAAFRAASEAVSVALRACIAELGWPVYVDGDRLMVDRGGRQKYVGELSAGERARLFLPHVARCLPPGSPVIVQQETWEGLDVTGRDALRDAVREAGVVLWTAQAEQDREKIGLDIRVEEYL